MTTCSGRLRSRVRSRRLTPTPTSCSTTSAFDYIDGTGKLLIAGMDYVGRLPVDTIESGDEFIAKSIHAGCRVCPPTAVFRVAALPSPPYDPAAGFAIDYLLWLRLALGSNIYFCASPGAAFRLHDGTISSGWSDVVQGFYRPRTRAVWHLWRVKQRFLPRQREHAREPPRAQSGRQAFELPVVPRRRRPDPHTAAGEDAPPRPWSLVAPVRPRRRDRVHGNRTAEERPRLTERSRSVAGSEDGRRFVLLTWEAEAARPRAVSTSRACRCAPASRAKSATGRPSSRHSALRTSTLTGPGVAGRADRLGERPEGELAGARPHAPGHDLVDRLPDQRERVVELDVGDGVAGHRGDGRERVGAAEDVPAVDEHAGPLAVRRRRRRPGRRRWSTPPCTEGTPARAARPLPAPDRPPGRTGRPARRRPGSRRP